MEKESLFSLFLKKHLSIPIIHRLQEWQDSKVDSDLDSKYEELEGGLRVPAKLWQSLYHYQKVAVQWLWELHQQDVGGILGDEMGLGKTVQMV